jgi:molybdenum cofactor cytidylyltransferase
VELSRALRIHGSRAVAFTGAGGKSSAIHRLVEELSPTLPVVVSTTTRLGIGQSSLARTHLILGQKPISELHEKLAIGGSILITGPASPDGLKWTGLPQADLERVWGAVKGSGGVLLIEADGARGRSLKAPAGHEPAVPEFTDLVVPVAGIDAVGQPLSGEFVHRPELLKRLFDIGDGDLITIEHLVRVLTSRDGGLKGVPHQAEVRCLLNKVQGEERIRAGEAAAVGITQSGMVRSVALGNTAEYDPVMKSIGRVGGIVLAAGGASRFGSQKLMHEFKGKPLARHAVDAAREGGLDPVVVVIGADAEAVRDGLGRDIPIVINHEWKDGQSTSLKKGLAEMPGGIEAVMFLLGDMPLVGEKLVRALLHAHRSTLAAIVAPRVGERWGNPALFDRVTFEALALIEGDRGGRALFGEYPPLGVDWGEEAAIDVDSDDDFQRFLHSR